jgi:hypothetical protein
VSSSLQGRRSYSLGLLGRLALSGVEAGSLCSLSAGRLVSPG